MDPLVKVARERAMLLRLRELSAEIEVQFGQFQGGRPVAEIWRRLRDEAADAMVALVMVDAENIGAVRDLQRKVLQFDDFVRVTKAIFHDGIEADRMLSAAELDELRDELMGSSEEEDQVAAAELGLVETGLHDA